MKILPALLFVAILSLCGCGDGGKDRPGTSRTRVVQLRKTANTNKYISAAREFLSEERDDMVAADVMTLYAQMRMTNEFRELGIRYATNSPTLLLEFADIANNESWGAMRDEFALETAAKANASYAELFRSARFLVQGSRLDEAETVSRRLAREAVKRYQLEDTELLTCEIALKRSKTPSTVVETLTRLANDAMMPQVRRDAWRMLSAIKKEE